MLCPDDDPFPEWCLGNVVAKPDHPGSLYPTKQRPEQKIDAAIALMMAVGRAMSDDGTRAGIDAFLTNPVVV